MSWLVATSPVCEQSDCDPVELLIMPRAHDIGAFEVRRALPSPQRRMVGPFIFFDQMGPATLPAGEGLDVRPHPHIGLSTITWLFEGEVRHQDSLGFDQVIRPGEVNWMTAGRGIVHSERSPDSQRDSDAPIAGIQAWLALPREQEDCEPAFHHYAADGIPHFDENGVRIALIAGSAWGQTSPVRVTSETLYADIRLAAGRSLGLPVETQERALYLYSGSLRLADTVFEAGSMIVLRPGSPVTIEASTDCRCMLLGGAPADGPRHIWWNFVATSKDRIEAAKADWREGRFAPVPGDDEFIPLPSD